MRRVTFDDAGERDLVFVLGWGNTPEHANVRWLIDHLQQAGYRVHTFEIPTTITDFEAEYLDPVATFVDELDAYRLLAHSTGGLIGAYLDDPITRVYLSPWWGIHHDQDGLLARLLARLPFARPIIPVDGDPAAIGDLVTDDQLADGPDAIAPTLVREVRRAQDGLPAVDDSAVVFYTPDDQVVSPAAIRERAPDANTVTYDGGHELFSSQCREAYLDPIRAALEDGVDALSDEVGSSE
jgi:hypothetical protein